MDRVMSVKSNDIAAAIYKMKKSDAVLEMPYKLMISMIILAVTLPIILGSTNNLLENQQEKELELQCTFLVNNIVLIYKQGAGSEKVIKLDLPAATKFVSAGGGLLEGPGSEPVSLRFATTYGQVQKIYTRVGSLYIFMSSPDNKSYDIDGGGAREVRLKKCRTNIDLNSDGSKPDFFIQLSNK